MAAVPTSGRRRSRVRDHTGDTSPELAIQAATERLLDTQSLQQLSASAIIEAAGVSRPTFYFYYPSKFAVVAALLQRIFAQIYESVQPWHERSGSERPDDLLRVVLKEAGTIWNRHSAAIRAAHENVRVSAEIGTVWLAIMEKFRQTTCEEIRLARSAAGLADDGIDPEVLSAGLIWSAERVLYVSTSGMVAQLPSVDAAIDALLAIWLPAIYGTAYNPARVQKQASVTGRSKGFRSRERPGVHPKRA
jgi:TetR/AcrR family transcriptional regulator, ethionamide resistance regulator